ncbi:hypothetical protein KAZ57_03395 [Patescibacteria group bacterium]|nr:hypothetical protein [Patescibacteria group bacterium]
MSTDTITKRLKILSDLNEELNKIKALYDESLENDPKYQEIQEEQNKVKDQYKEQRAKILEDTTFADLNNQVKELRQDIKENKEILAQELADYYKDSGSLEIVDEEGNTKKIVFSAKLIS